MANERLRQLVARALIAGALLLPAASRSQEKEAVQITISVYSGRPDPVLRLQGGAELDEVRARLESAPVDTRADRRSVIAPVLGYRGVIVENRGGAKGIPSRVAVHGGRIEVGDKERSFRLDKDRALEDLLLTLALKHGAIDAKLYDKIKSRWR